MDRLHARYWRKDLLEVYALALNKDSGDETRLMLDNGAELVPFDFVHPLQANRTASWRWIDKPPCLVFLDHLHLLQHRLSLVSVALGQCERGWFLYADKQQLLIIEQPTSQP